jgi:NAD(P)-dependent dehydrogenase (short-subunit alcohol dehydrogenase family)
MGLEKIPDTHSLFDVSGKVALITGATGALGEASAKGLAKAGVKVMLTARTETKLAELAQQIQAAGFTAAYCAGNPADEDDVKRVVQETVQLFSGIDILITAAGLSRPRAIVEQTLEEWQSVMDANVKATWLFCKYAGQVMIDQGRGGKVILVSSTRGQLGMANYGAYSPSKGAVHLLTRSLGCEWGKHGINVNAIAPTVFRSALTQWIYDDPAAYNRFLTRVPIGRLGEPEDFIGSVIFLSSKASDFMTGAILYVDGGYTAG